MKNYIRRKLLLLLAALACMSLALLLDGAWLPAVKNIYIRHRTAQIQKNLFRKEKAADQILNIAIAYIPEQLYRNENALYELSRKNGVFLYIFNSSGLIFWTSNTVLPSHTDFSKHTFIQHLENGMFLQRNIHSHGFTFITLIPIKYKYSLKNQYIHSSLALYQGKDINFKLNEPGGIAIYSLYGDYLFNLTAGLRQQGFSWVGWLFLIGLTLFCIFIIGQVNYWLKGRRTIYALALSFLFIGILIFFWKIVRLPAVIFSWPVFSASHFATSYIFSSIGDLLIFSLLLIYCVWFLLSLPVKIRLKNVALIGVWALLFFAAGWLQALIQSLVLDSQISFNLSNIFTLNIFSFGGLFIILSWTFLFFLLCRHLVKKGMPAQNFWLILIATALLYAAVSLLLSIFHVLGFVFALSIIIGCYLFIQRDRHNFLWLTYLLISALFLTACFSRDNFINKQQNMQSVANKLATEHDAVAEYLFANIFQGIKADNFVHSYFEMPIPDNEMLEERLKQLFFSGYFSKYDIDIYSFTSQGLPFKSIQSQPLSYYQSGLRALSTPVKGSNLYSLHTYSGLPAYAAIIPIAEGGIQEGYLFIQMQEKAFYEESVYPQLLLNESIGPLKNIDNYSYAIYNKNVLVNQHGSYPYSGVLGFNLPVDSFGNAFYSEGGFDHVAHIYEDNVVIISSPRANFLYYSSIFSLLLLLSALLSGIVWLIPFLVNEIRRKWLYRQPIGRSLFFWRRTSFRNKILITVLGGMTIAMLIVGIVTVYYIDSQYNKDVVESLRKKTRAIAAGIDDYYLSAGNSLPVGNSDFSSFLKNLSHNYQSDINVFNVNGTLVATTQELLYENNVLTTKMDPSAWLHFYVGNASQLIQKEKIGILKYISSYIPLRDRGGIITGFVNLPYFSKSKELNDRISSFIVALVNLYLLVMLFLIVIGLFLSQRLTAPLNIIRSHLHNISLEHPNEIIEWENDDEIGKLIHAYNSLINDLQESAARISESQRESGWKDMAQTIAHDIKNPLTPMKLHIQRMQNALAKGSGKLEEIFPKVSDMLIRQIDLLTETTNMVSDYAKLSKGHPQKINLNRAIQDVVYLFSHQDNKAIHCFLPKEALYVTIDPSQLSRVFNNLVRNALQSIPEGKKGIIQIAAYKDDSHVVIKIEDNGVGIPEAYRENIFQPRFSTKTAGSGLGLAIVRRIIELAGGGIHFVTTPGAGTTFIIRLPESDVVI